MRRPNSTKETPATTEYRLRKSDLFDIAYPTFIMPSPYIKLFNYPTQPCPYSLILSHAHKQKVPQAYQRPRRQLPDRHTDHPAMHAQRIGSSQLPCPRVSAGSPPHRAIFLSDLLGQWRPQRYQGVPGESMVAVSRSPGPNDTRHMFHCSMPNRVDHNLSQRQLDNRNKVNPP